MKDLALILLCLLPSSYASFRDTILYCQDTLTIDDVYDTLHSKEKLKHLIGATSRDDEALISHGDRQRDISKNNSNLFCLYCRCKGHIRKDYDKLLAKSDLATNCGAQPLTSDETNVVEDFSNDGDVTLTVVSDVESRPDKEWILDSACSHPMCSNWNFFQTYEAVQQGEVVMENNQSCCIAGIGQVGFRLRDGTIRTIDKVCHVSDLKRNLILLSTLDAKGYKFSGGGGGGGGGGVLKVRKDIRFVLEGRKMS